MVVANAASVNCHHRSDHHHTRCALEHRYDVSPGDLPNDDIRALALGDGDALDDLATSCVVRRYRQ